MPADFLPSVAAIFVYFWPQNCCIPISDIFSFSLMTNVVTIYSWSPLGLNQIRSQNAKVAKKFCHHTKTFRVDLLPLFPFKASFGDISPLWIRDCRDCKVP